MAAVLPLMLAAACADEPAEKSDTSYRTPTLDSVSMATENLQLPFDAFALPEADLQEMQRGHAELLSKCLAERGLSATFAGDYLRPPGDRLLWGGPFGTMTLDHAQRFGYKAGPEDPFTLGPGFYIKEPTNVFPLDADPEVQRALDGGAEGADDDDQPGCRAQVESDISEGIVSVVDVRSDVMNLAFNDPRVQEAMKKWRTCMEELGHTTYSAVQEAVEEFTLASLTPAQSEVAVDDVGCTNESGWPNLYYAVLTAYQEQALDKFTTTFEAHLDSERKRLARIQELRADG